MTDRAGEAHNGRTRGTHRSDCSLLQLACCRSCFSPRLLVFALLALAVTEAPPSRRLPLLSRSSGCRQAQVTPRPLVHHQLEGLALAPLGLSSLSAARPAGHKAIVSDTRRQTKLEALHWQTFLRGHRPHPRAFVHPIRSHRIGQDSQPSWAKRMQLPASEHP